MARKHKHPEHVSHERWLVSYADFITLLFAFFVVMFAVSQVDSRKLGRFVESVEVAFNMRGVFPNGSGSPLQAGGGKAGESIVQPVVSPTPTVLDFQAPSPVAKATKEALVEHMAAAGLTGRVQVRYDEHQRGVVVSVPEDGFFRSASSNLDPAAIESLRAIAAAIRDESGPESVAILVEGHTDDLSVSSPIFATNWELSSARAARVVRYLIDEGGLSPERLSATGFADTRPLIENSSEENRVLNRRVDVVIATEAAAD
jgi:chemotaxis protein MotB